MPENPWGPIDVCSGESWLAALADPRCAISNTAAFLTPVPGTWTTSPRVSPEYLTTYLFCSPRARLRMRLDRGEVAAPTGALLWFAPGVPYELALESRRRSEGMLRLRFRLERRGRLLALADEPLVLTRPEAALSLIHRLAAEWRHPDGFSETETRHLLGSLSIQVLRRRSSGRGLTADQLDRLAALVAERLDQRLTPRDLARRLGLAPLTFTRSFRASTGIPPRVWLVRERIHHAAERLREGREPITAVAEAFGYANPFLFTRQFTAVMGRSPRAWRDGAEG